MDRATLGPYELLEPVGQGGMGAVYRARDSRLGRLVAIKVIAGEGFGDPELRRRLLGEARAASALAHPHIVTIYEIGEAAGIDYIVMEFVDGESLARHSAPGRDGRRSLPLDDALRIGSQVAGALAAAHEIGIVHRDLKPSNVMITRDGRAKLLDFGLAKATSGPDGTATGVLTMTAEPLTAEGTILGTVGYMSPEQAEGKPVDARSDIFSFGVLLWEMLTGRRAFQRESVADTLAAVLRDELPPPSSIAPDLTPDLDQVVSRCLSKDPARRIQHVADVKVILDEAIAQRISSSVRTATRPAAAAAPGRRLRYALLAGAAIIALAALAVPVARRAIAPREAVPAGAPGATATREIAISRFSFDPGVTFSPALTRDGSVAAYASDRAGRGDLDIYVQQVAGRQAVRVTDHEADDHQPFFSPDGAKIVFRSERDGGGIFVVEAFGGEPRRIAEQGWFPRFSPDGTTISIVDLSPYPYTEGAPMVLLSATGGEPRPLAPGYVSAAPPFAVGPLWSPDGQQLLFRGKKLGVPGAGDWWIVAAEGGEPTPLLAGQALALAGFVHFPFAWTDEGVFFVRGTTMEGFHLYRVRLAADRVSFEGPPEKLVASNEMAYAGAVSNDGRILFPIMEWQPSFATASLEADQGRVVGALEEVPGDRLTKGGLSLSRDGRQMVYGAILSAREQRVEVRLRDLSTGRERTVTSVAHPSFMTAPCLSPDGRTLAFMGRAESGGRRAFLVGVEGGAPREFCRDCGVLGFFPDGRSACVWTTPNDVVRLPIEGGEKRTLFRLGEDAAHAGWDIGDAAVSSDERFLLLLLGRGHGAPEVRIVPIDGAPKTERDGFVVATDARFLSCPRWSPGGDLVYYLAQRDGRIGVWAQRLERDTKRPRGEPFLVTHLGPLAHLVPRTWTGLDVAPGRLLVSASRWEANLWTGVVE